VGNGGECGGRWMVVEAEAEGTMGWRTMRFMVRGAGGGRIEWLVVDIFWFGWLFFWRENGKVSYEFLRQTKLILLSRI